MRTSPRPRSAASRSCGWSRLRPGSKPICSSGRHAQLIGELEALLIAQPARERVAGRLMLALYRWGRQVEALYVYQRTRGHLAQELGLEPGPGLRALQEDILRHAPSLGVPSTGPSAPTDVASASRLRIVHCRAHRP